MILRNTYIIKSRNIFILIPILLKYDAIQFSCMFKYKYFFKDYEKRNIML